MNLASKTYSKLLALLVLGLVACSGEDPEASSPEQLSVFTGRMDTADSVVGLTMSAKGDVYAYVCGGDTTFATHSRWFAGTLSPNSASLENEGYQLEVTPQDDSMDITLTTPDGTMHSTAAKLAGPGNRSALYESSPNADCPWGVVVVDDGGVEPEVFGTWCGLVESAKIFAQVTPVRPIDFSKELLPVLVNTPAGEEQFEVRRASASPAVP